MIYRRAVAFALGEERTLFLRFDRPLRYLMESCPDSLMADSHAAVDHLLDHNLLRPYPVLHLVELAVELDGMVILEGPLGLYAENRVEVSVFDRSVQILFLLWFYRKAPVGDYRVSP